MKAHRNAPGAVRMPEYYSSLARFRDLFAAGTPILTYHRMGPRPRGVRVKGLYVSGRLFTRQLNELRGAGFRSASLGDDIIQPDNSGRRIVITFDDGFASTLAHGIGPLAACGFRAIQFIVADRMGRLSEWEADRGEKLEPLMEPGQVREWMAAGHEIGSHTLTHPRLTRIPPEKAREEIVSSRKKLEDLFGARVDHFCYPWGDWNPAVRDLVIEAGYKTACTTDLGVNTAGTSPFELRRFMARYRTLRLKHWFRF